MTLECKQCGLSCVLMLKKQEIFHACFDNFDYDPIVTKKRDQEETYEKD